uniref:Transcription factor TFIIB cyclin-like domain-containing protein n=1 Tax=viral metagenome TaxID=1070528 RepID=A0A6C0I7V1_9ZZZZ
MCDHEKRCIEDGQSVCCGCGTILEQQIDDGPEWRYYGADDRNEDPCRTGSASNALLPDSSYGSMAMNIKCTSPQFKQIIRMSSWALASCSERSWIAALDICQTYAYRAGLPKAILVDACTLLKGQEDALKLRGETRRALIGAVFFVSCRRNGVSRTHEEIANMVNVGTRSLCKAIQRFDIQVKIDNPLMMTQLSLAERMMNGMTITEDQRQQILESIQNMFKSPDEELEHTPKVMVAGLIARVLTDGIPDPKSFVKTFSKSCGVSVVSIHKVMAKL